MNFIDNRTRSIGAMALDGLQKRAAAIGANTVNALTPNYQRKEVSFENSLQKIIERENEKEEIKLQNSMMYEKNPAQFQAGQSLEQLAFLNSPIHEGFSIDIDQDMAEPIGLDGNNVNIEREMMDEAKNGMQYSVIASLMSKSFASMNAIIKGQNQ